MKLDDRRFLIVVAVIGSAILAHETLGDDPAEKMKIAFGALVLATIFAMGFWSPKPTKEQDKREHDRAMIETRFRMDEEDRIRREMAEEKEERVRRHMERERNRRAAEPRR
ncbi:MAG: hypothetical protein ACK4UQ_06500 [Brevundimonas sp.]